MPTKDLPGFYFDEEKNRYFPIKGPVPGRASKRPAQICAPCVPEPIQRAKRTKAAELLQMRELHGKLFNFNKQRQSFEQTCFNLQASNPLVWKYPATDGLADSAVCQFKAVIQTPKGQKETNVLAMGSMSGGICIREIENIGWHQDRGPNALPTHVWPPAYKDLHVLPVSLWGPAEASTNFPCSVSSLNKIGSHHHTGVDDQPVLQDGLASTLGFGGSGGSLYMLSLKEPLDFNSNQFSLQRRIRKVGSLDCTVWTAVCDADGGQAAVGTNRGAALINIESGKISWLYHCKSDIFSEQFDNSGNILLCGHRNGSITSIDIRQRHRSHFGRSRKPPRHAMGPAMKQLEGNSGVPSATCMPSAVCSLAILMSDDRYFLGSSMDGSIKLFDRCLLGRGPVQSYEGHLNSHSRLQLGVDQSETLFLSGGEDGYARIWNIKTADLLFAKRISDSPLSSICWRQDASANSRWLDENQYSREHTWHAWLGSQEGVFCMHGK